MDYIIVLIEKWFIISQKYIKIKFQSYIWLIYGRDII